MAGYRPKPQVVSLLAFLRTGEFGPLRLGMTFREVADLLEPPDWWMDAGSDAPVPRLWGYDQHLEVLFDHEPPHLVKNIKLHNLPSAGKASIRIRRPRLKLDGLHDDLPASGMLRREIWGDVPIVVGQCMSWNPVSDIVTSKVRLVWSLSTDGERSLEDEGISQQAREIYTARRDALSDHILGIYSNAQPKADRMPSDGWDDFTPAEYLVAVGGTPDE